MSLLMQNQSVPLNDQSKKLLDKTTSLNAKTTGSPAPAGNPMELLAESSVARRAMMDGSSVRGDQYLVRKASGEKELFTRRDGQFVNAAGISMKEALAGEKQFKPTKTMLERERQNAENMKRRAGKGILSGRQPKKQGILSGRTTAQPEEAPATPFNQEAKKQIYDMMSRQQQLLSETQSTVKGLSDTYQRSFQELTNKLGEQAASFKQQLQQFATNNNKAVDIESPEFQQEMEQAIATGQTDFTSIFDKYSKSPTEQEAPGTFDQQEFKEIQGLAEQAVKAGLPQKDADFALEGLTKRGLPMNQIRDFFEGKISGQDVTGAAAVEDVSKDTQPTVDSSQGLVVDLEPEKEIPESEKIGNALDSTLKLNGDSLMTTLTSMGLDPANMSSSELLQTMLLQQGLAIADDPAVENYLNKGIERAQQAQYEAQVQFGNSVKDIDKAISGEEFTPTTFEGVAAKAYAQSKDLNMESVAAEKEWLETQHDVWMSQERDKRGRLEGYLKAKLYAAGAQDSSAGLSTMALAVNAADLNIQLKEGEHRYAMSQLNIQSRQIMNEFTNNVVELGMKAEAAKGEAMAKAEEQIYQIEGKLIESSKEKDKLKLSAFGTFVDKMQEIDEQKKAQARWEYEKQYQKIRDVTEDAYKLSGLMGTYHYANEKGEVVDTGQKTLDYKQWEDTAMMNKLKYEQGIENDTWGKAMDLLDFGDRGAVPVVEQMLGMAPGTLASIDTPEERKMALEEYKRATEIASGVYSNSLGDGGYTIGENGDVIMVNDGGVISGMFTPGFRKSKMFPGMGLQCAEFMHKFFDIGPLGSSLAAKKRHINTPKNYAPKVGDMVFTSESKQYGHVAVINAVDYQNNTITLTEANFKGKGVVSNDRVLRLDSPVIAGYHTGNLKPEISRQLGELSSSKVNKYVDTARQEGLEKAEEMLAKIKDDQERQVAQKLFDDAIRTPGPTYDAGRLMVDAFGLPTSGGELELAIKEGLISPTDLQKVTGLGGYRSDPQLHGLRMMYSMLEGVQIKTPSLYDQLSSAQEPDEESSTTSTTSSSSGSSREYF